jgi:tetratricopeptide (TPR) repeat protein
VQATALVRLGEIGACEAALDRALAAARRARDRRRANAVLAGAPLAALWGPSPVTRASGRCLDVVRVLRITQGAPAVEAVALSCQAVLEALRGRTDAGRRMIASARHMVEELGITHRLLEVDVFAGLIELLEGDAPAAERCLRAAYEGLRDQGLAIDAARAAALLGRALLAQGRGEEAETASLDSEALAGDDLKAAIAWRGVRAEAMARRGEHGAAVGLARAGVVLAAATDALLDHADARQALASVLRAAGQSGEADAEERRAVELWQAKGATLLVGRAQSTGAVVREAAVARPEEGPPARLRRVRENAAIGEALRLQAAVAARDVAAVRESFGGLVEVVDHPTGSTFDGRAMLAVWRSFLAAQEPELRHEPLATLGESLALLRGSMSFEALAEGTAPFGPVSRDEIVFIEVGPHGRHQRLELFAPDHLGDAVARLYERHAERLPEGPDRTRAAATARTVAALVEAPDLVRWAAGFAPAIEFFDPRTVGFGSVQGAEAVLGTIRALFDLSESFGTRIDDVLALRSDALVVRWTSYGTQREGGGAFERELCQLWVFGSDGRLARWEQYAGDRDAEALARFDELAAAQPATRFANAATRSFDEFARCWNARDWDGVVATYVPLIRFVDRRSLTGVDLEGADFLANLRVIFEMGPSRYHGEPLATRGDRLALFRWRLEGQNAEVGPVEFEYVGVVEVDAGGRGILNSAFDSSELDAAYAELDERYRAGEGAPFAELLAHLDGFRRAAGASDPIALAPLLPADFTMRSHRRFASTGETLTRDEYLASMATLQQMDDVRSRLRLDHLRISDGAAIADSTLIGTRDGGNFEISYVAVFRHDGRRVREMETFESDQLADALARYEMLSSVLAPSARIENAATRSEDSIRRAWQARDWEALTELFPIGFRSIDRRPLMHLEVDRDTMLAGLRPFVEMAVVRSSELVATRGEQLALYRMRLSGGEGDIGLSEVELLQVIQTDGNGTRRAAVAFAPDDVVAAYGELEARYHAGEGTAHPQVAAAMRGFQDAFARRDWEALAAVFAPELVVSDHRRLGWERLDGLPAYVRSLRSLVDLAPDARLRIDHVRASENALLWVAAWVGTRDGGPFETPWIIVSEHDARGRVVRFDQYDLDQLDRARARFAEVAAPRPTVARIENAATRSAQRTAEAWQARDWARLDALFAPGFRLLDRRALSFGEVDRERHLQNLRLSFDMPTSRYTSEVLATRGERLALSRMLWSGAGRVTGPSEIEWLEIAEMDGTGRFAAIVTFDSGDLDAAYDELDERYTTSEGGGRGWAELRSFLDAFARRDWEALGALCPSTLEVHDHRMLGWGVVDGRAFVDLLRSLVELAPDVRLDTDHVLAGHGAALGVGVMSGTREGGTFELPRSVSVHELDGSGGLCRIDMYSLEQLDEARARFETLRQGLDERSADALRIPPNAAWRIWDRIAPIMAAADWPALRSLASAEFVFDDRQRRSLVRGDVELYIRNLEFVRAWPGRTVVRELLATAGERSAVDRVAFTGDPEGGAFEGEFLRLTELDDDGRLLAVIHFDPDDRRAATIELRERYFRSEEGRSTPAELIEVTRALDERDPERVRAALPPDFVFHDHRRTGVGRIEGVEDYLASIQAMFEQTLDGRSENLYRVAADRHGTLHVARTVGSLLTGGAFESVYVRLQRYRGERWVATELYELEDLERARARFDELRAEGAIQ